MRHKYKTLNPRGKQKGDPGAGRYVDPSKWVTGPDPVRHDKYYAWLKHRSQARYRDEDYELTWEQWESLWPNELWFRRGRARTDLCLQRIDPTGAWSMSNCEITTRLEHLRTKRQRELNGR